MLIRFPGLSFILQIKFSDLFLTSKSFVSFKVAVLDFFIMKN